MTYKKEIPLEVYIRSIFHYIRYNAEEATASYDITCQQGRLLEIIVECVNENIEISRKYLQNRLLISGPSVTSLLNNLESKGFIERSVNTEDGRAFSIKVTEKGKSVISDVKLLFQQQEKKLVDGMSQTEINMFRMLLEKSCLNIGVTFDK